MAELEESQSPSSRRIAKNALMLYIRMFLTMIVGLYTSRVVLNTLGVEDYGIYGVVGGIVAMMGFLNASMSGATSRFITFELGKGNQQRLNDTFSSAMIVHIGIALVVLIIAETIGLWFLNNKLVIPEGRMEAAHWVYQLSIASAMLGITQVPYNACIIAHERMGVYAYIEILNVTLKLLIVYLLTIGDFDKLKLYAVLMFIVSIIVLMTYRIYSMRKFRECHFHWVWNKEILRPLLSFSGWDLYGNMSFSVKQQATGFILNIFYGVIINAAANIATTIQNILTSFASNIITAFRPPIIKAYARSEYSSVNRLMNTATKFSSIILSLLAIPIIIRTDQILLLWLGTIPEYSIEISQLCLIACIINPFSSIILIIIHATGKIKLTTFICGSLYLISILIQYILLYLGYSYISVFILAIMLGILFVLINAFICKHLYPQFEIFTYSIKVILPILTCWGVSYFIGTYLSTLFPSTLLGNITFCICTILFIITISYIVILSKRERSLIKEKCRFHK